MTWSQPCALLLRAVISTKDRHRPHRRTHHDLTPIILVFDAQTNTIPTSSPDYSNVWVHPGTKEIAWTAAKWSA
jgi:hypothetical protein